MRTINMDFTFGMISDVATKACQMAKEKNVQVNFKFNTIELRALPTSEPQDIAWIYNLEHVLRSKK